MPPGRCSGDSKVRRSHQAGAGSPEFGLNALAPRIGTGFQHRADYRFDERGIAPLTQLTCFEEPAVVYGTERSNLPGKPVPEITRAC